MNETWVGIAQMARASGFSIDTLRWYEKAGILPPAERGPDGRRRYGPREQGMVLLLVRLRETGMPTTDMRAFVELLGEGAASHGRRIALLEAARDRLTERRRVIDAAQAALDDKIAHYERLIAAGLDCSGSPVPTGLRMQQAARDTTSTDREAMTREETA